MILFVQSHLTYPGGGTSFVLRAADQLSRLGLDVGIMAISAREETIRPFRHLKYYLLGGPLPDRLSHWVQFPALMHRVEACVSSLRPDVIFPHVFPSSCWGLLYKRRHPETPCVWYCHEPSAFVHNMQSIRGLRGPVRYAAMLSNPAMRLVDRKIAGYADKIITNSRFTAGNIRRIYGREAEVVYPTLLDLESFDFRLDKEDYLFALGMLTRPKRMDLLLKALAVLKDRGKTVSAVVGGDGPERAGLVEMARALGVERQVAFTGVLTDEDARRYLSRSRVVVYPATDEPFGLVPVEAMACGTPVIASRSGGPQETVVDGVTGFLFDAGDHRSLAEKIALLSDGGVDAREMGRAAREWVAKNFTCEKTATRLYELFAPYVAR